MSNVQVLVKEKQMMFKKKTLLIPILKNLFLNTNLSNWHCYVISVKS